MLARAHKNGSNKKKKYAFATDLQQHIKGSNPSVLAVAG